jgi:hypothetical protein
MHVKTITVNYIFEQLVAIARATNGGARGGTVLCSDLIDQDALYTLQERLAVLLAEVADASGPDATKRLMREFPYAFERR